MLRMRLTAAFATTVATLVAISAATPRQAAAENGVSIGLLCQIYGGAFPSQGECVKTVATLYQDACKADYNNNGTPDWADVGFKSQGECISTFVRLYHDYLRTLPT
jgi:hypothetical protein